MGNQTQVSDSDSLTFNAEQGTFTYGVTAPYGYSVSPKEGTVTLLGPDLYVTVTFTKPASDLSLALLFLAAVAAGVGAVFAAVWLKSKIKIKP